MASLEKYDYYGTVNMLQHNYRVKEKYSNNSIDLERSKDNEVIMGAKNYVAAMDKLSAALCKVPHSNRRDLITSVGYVITLPEGITTKQEEEEFGKEAINQVKKEGGEGRVLSAIIHKDENKKHLHVLVLPIVKAENDIGGKFCAKEFITYKLLINWHRNLQKSIDKNKILGPAIRVMTGQKAIEKAQREERREMMRLK